MDDIVTMRWELETGRRKVKDTVASCKDRTASRQLISIINPSSSWWRTRKEQEEEEKLQARQHFSSDYQFTVDRSGRTTTVLPSWGLHCLLCPVSSVHAYRQPTTTSIRIACDLRTRRSLPYFNEVFSLGDGNNSRLSWLSGPLSRWDSDQNAVQPGNWSNQPLINCGIEKTQDNRLTRPGVVGQPRDSHHWFAVSNLNASVQLQSSLWMQHFEYVYELMMTKLMKIGLYS